MAWHRPASLPLPWGQPEILGKETAEEGSLRILSQSQGAGGWTFKVPTSGFLIPFLYIQ